MKFFTKKQSKRKNSEIIVVGIVLSVLFLSSMFPGAVDAQGGISFFFSKEAKAEEQAVFPTFDDIEPRAVITAVMTAYSSDVGQTDSTPCIPADWTYNLCEHYELYGEQNSIAANFLPMGTQVKFPELYGDKIFVVRDRMNARYGYGRGDIWMPTYEEAKNFGVKRVTMEIYYR